MIRQKPVFTLLACIFLIGISGCSGSRRAARNDIAEIKSRTGRYKQELNEKEALITALQAELEHLHESQIPSLLDAQKSLEAQLKEELAEYKTKLAMTERGLVVSFLAEVFFDSGKAVIKEEGKKALQKVAEVLNNEAKESPVAVEGHTDNDPIKYSGWKSNWELSSARALAVLHYFIDTCGVAPERLSANAYGQYHPVASNDTDEGKQTNRRVEIVILPPLEKVKESKSLISSDAQ
jgi:chemotaxis protein MotB